MYRDTVDRCLGTSVHFSGSCEEGRDPAGLALAAGDFVRRIDEIQYTLDEGRCLQAYATQELVLTEDLEHEQRLPWFRPVALTHGLRGLVAVPLTVQTSRLGALNVYALQARVFDETAGETAALFAEQASIVLG